MRATPRCGRVLELRWKGLLLGVGALVWLACTSRAEQPPSAGLAAGDAVEPAPLRSHDVPVVLERPSQGRVPTGGSQPEATPSLAEVGREATGAPATEQASTAASDRVGALIVRMFRHHVRALHVCLQQGQQGELSTGPVSLTVDLQIASRGNVSALHVADVPTGQRRAADCASHLFRRFRFNPGPEEERAYRLRVVVGENSRIESWSRKEDLLRVDDPKPPPLLGRPAGAPSQLQRVLREGKVTGTAAEVLGQQKVVKGR